MVYPVSQMLLAVISLSCGYGVCLVLYRLLLHPLANFPGPKLAAATYWYDFYIDCLKGPTPGRMLFHVEELHEKYGPVVRVNPDELSVKDPHWYDVLYNSSRRDKWPRNHKANGSAGSVATTASRSHHKLRKTPLFPFFSRRSIDQLEPLIAAKVDLLSSGLRKYIATQEPLNIGVAFTAMTLDIISDYCFRQSWRCLEQPGFSPEWKALMTKIFEPVPFVKQFPWTLRSVSSLPLTWQKKIAPDMAMMFDAKLRVEKQVTNIVNSFEAQSCSPGQGLREEVTQEFKDDQYDITEDGFFKSSEDANQDTYLPDRTIFHHLLASNLPLIEKTVARLTDEGFVMVVAGGETTAKTLTNMLFYIHAPGNERWLAKLQHEVDSVMPDPNVLASQREVESRCPTIIAVAKETLRICHPVTNRLQLIPTDEDLYCNGWTIPRGTPVSMSGHLQHLDPSIFEKPRVFDPSRWMTLDLKVLKQNNELDKFLVPFAKGPRSCVGQNLAWSELILGLAAVVRKFEFELEVGVTEAKDVTIVRDCFVGMPTKESEGVLVKVLGERR